MIDSIQTFFQTTIAPIINPLLEKIPLDTSITILILAFIIGFWVRGRIQSPFALTALAVGAVYFCLKYIGLGG